VRLGWQPRPLSRGSSTPDAQLLMIAEMALMHVDFSDLPTARLCRAGKKRANHDLSPTGWIKTHTDQIFILFSSRQVAVRLHEVIRISMWCRPPVQKYSGWESLFQASFAVLC
jgi:hypothetical protein